MAQTHNTKRNGILLVGAILSVLALVGLLAGGAAALGTADVDVSENETVAVGVDFDGETDVTVEILDDTDEVVASDTLDSTGEDLPVTLETEFDQLDAGEYTVDLTATDDTAVTGHSVDVSYHDTVEPDDETVVVDVEFTDASSATVTIENDTFSDTATLEATTDDLDGVDSFVNTTEFADLNGTYDVSVEYEDSMAVEESYVSVEGESAFGGIIAGAGQTELLAFAAVVVGLIYAYREDYI